MPKRRYPIDPGYLTYAFRRPRRRGVAVFKRKMPGSWAARALDALKTRGAACGEPNSDRCVDGDEGTRRWLEIGKLRYVLPASEK